MTARDLDDTTFTLPTAPSGSLCRMMNGMLTLLANRLGELRR